MPAPIPVDEALRLKALRNYAILDTEPDAAFDDITRLAASICDTPIALVSFVDEDRQWFLSRHGTELRETDRCLAFCAHAIFEQELFEVPDASVDERFLDHPMVIEDPNIRFYAGALLTSPDGQNIGTLCVIDTVPRRLTEAQRASLLALARQVSRLLDGLVVRRQLASALAALDAFDRQLPVCVICDELSFSDKTVSLQAFVETHTPARFHPTVCAQCIPQYAVEPNVAAAQFT
jgi:GAF domain-containing protein